MDSLVRLALREAPPWQPLPGSGSSPAPLPAIATGGGTPTTRPGSNDAAAHEEHPEEEKRWKNRENAIK